MWNYPWLFKPHRPYLFPSTACIALTGVALFMHGLSLCFSTWVLLVRSVRRKPLPPSFAQAAGELSGSCGQAFAPSATGRGISFIRAPAAVISHCNLCFWILWSTLPWLWLNFVSKACGSQHLLVQDVRWFQRGRILFLWIFGNCWLKRKEKSGLIEEL